MRKSFYRIAWLGMLVAGFTACEREKEPDVEPDDAREYRFVRLMVSDEVSNQISLVNPRDGKIETFQTKFPKASLYTTESGRFAAFVHRDNHLVEFFDSGFEYHGDHVDIKGTPKWAGITSDGKMPTHFASHANEVAIFNDGDGTFSIGNEADFHKAGTKMQHVDVGGKAHHGAMLRFDNGTYAVTEKDGSVAGTLPERVKVVDKSGKTLFASTVQTKGIHGDATDGKIGLFGSASGVLVVEANGNQRLIPHPAGFGNAWFGTILYAREADKFIGYTAAMGAYLIDVKANTITPIIDNKDIMQCKTDMAGAQLAVLLHSGEAKVYDLKTNTLRKEGALIPATAKDDKQKPTLAATKKYLYVTMPKLGEVHSAEIANLSNIQKIKVNGTPYRLTVVGIESNEEH